MNLSILITAPGYIHLTGIFASALVKNLKHRKTFQERSATAMAGELQQNALTESVRSSSNKSKCQPVNLKFDFSFLTHMENKNLKKFSLYKREYKFIYIKLTD